MKQKNKKEKPQPAPKAQQAPIEPAPAPAPAPAVKIPLAWRKTILQCDERDTHTALLLLMYCQQHGSRTIVGAKGWSTAYWITYVGVEGVRPCNNPYWRWEGADLVVLFASQNTKEQ